MDYGKLIYSCLWLLGFLVSYGMGPAAAAREPQGGETVVNRPRPEVDPLGFPVGGFQAYGQLALTEVYDTNVFATPVDERSDYITVVSPRAALLSDWTRHALNFWADADIGRYWEYTKQDFNDWRVAADGRLDVTRNVQIFAGGEYAHLHQLRTSPDDTRGLEPTQYDKTSAFVRYRQRLGRFSFAPQATFERFEYDNVPAIRNGMLVSIDQQFRNRDEYSLDLRVGYELIQESNELFVRLRGIDRVYDQLQPFPLGPLPGFPSEIDRSSTGYEADVGLDLDLGGITFGQVFVGYRQENYKSPLPDIGTPTFGVSVDWNPTRLTTINLNVERSINEVTQALYSGYISTVGRLSIDHELRRDFLLNVNFSLADHDYVGVSTPVGTAKREDTIYGVGVAAKYFLNRHLYASLGYTYLQRNSSDNTLPPGSLNRDYKIHLVYLSLETQY